MLKSDLCKLDIPVAEDIPDKVVKLRNGDTELKFFEVVGDLFRELIKQRKYPLVLKCKLFGNARCRLVFVKVHQNKSCGIPDFVGKVTACLNLLFGITHVVSGAVARCQRQTKGICAVFVDNDQRINTVAQGL